MLSDAFVLFYFISRWMCGRSATSASKSLTQSHRRRFAACNTSFNRSLETRKKSLKILTVSRNKDFKNVSIVKKSSRRQFLIYIFCLFWLSFCTSDLSVCLLLRSAVVMPLTQKWCSKSYVVSMSKSKRDRATVINNLLLNVIRKWEVMHCLIAQIVILGDTAGSERIYNFISILSRQSWRIIG